MIPILFEKTETAFADNGIARLRDTLSAVVSEERNGIYELDFTYPVTGANYEKIICGRLVGVTHDESGDIQPFEIVQQTRPINGIVSFHCVHLSYRQSQMTATGSNINSLSDAFALLKTATPSNPFEYETDITSTGYMVGADGTPLSVRQLLGGVRGSILDTYGGEYEWNKWTVKLHSSRGEMKDFAIRYGVNLLDYNDEASYQGTFTSCVAFWKSEGEIVTTTATLNENGYNGNDICVPLDLSDKFESKPTTTQLENEALAYMRRNQTNIPSQSIRVDFVRLADMGEFSQFQDLLACKLCDSIKVIFPMYGVSAFFKIVKTEWNVLEGKYIGMELGTLSTTLSEALGIGETSTSGVSGGGGLDYIVEEGTEGIWSYRVWNSGFAEAWGTQAFTTMTASQPWGALYYDVLASVLTFPNGLFSSAPDIQLTLNGQGGNFWVTISNDTSATNVGTIYAIAPTQITTNKAGVLHIYASGGGTLTRDVHLAQSGDVLILT